jgi:D-alanyl-D-alanine carboxypeptidase
MLMVKSANDMAVVLAEGVAGSVDAFAEQMNSTAQRLGMTQTHYVNPNGLPEDAQVTSARDQGILARAVLRDLPEYDLYWHIPAIKFGKRVMRNTNSLLGRYPGVDGMKTGFICASGFNVVASATRGGRRLIAVVLGSPSSAVRSVKAAQLFERGFNSGGPLSWLTPSLGTVDALVPVNAEPADLRDQTCGKHRRRPAAESVDDEDESESGADSGSPRALFLANHRGAPKPSTLLGPPAPVVNPVVVFVGAPKRGGPLLAAASAAEAAGGRPGRKGTGGTVPAEPALAAAASPWPNLASPFTPSEAVAATAAQGLSSSPAVQAIPLPRPRPRVRPAAAAQPRAGNP